jgi:hypothetical protein
MFIHKTKLTISALLMAFVVVFTLACGSSESEDELFLQISDPGRVYSLDEMIATPYKEVSNYSTEGLPGASDASFGFMKIGSGEPYEYEVRFYESHQAAVDTGTAMVIEGSGADAIISGDNATYKQGVKNRRTIIGGGFDSIGSGVGPKFGSYAIFGNIVMLCEGPDPETSLERCALLANELLREKRSRKK